VRRALKHAVTAGLLRHRSGRYKILATLNPVSKPVSSANKNSINNDQKIKERKLKLDSIQVPNSELKLQSRETRERKYVMFPSLTYYWCLSPSHFLIRFVNVFCDWMTMFINLSQTFIRDYKPNSSDELLRTKRRIMYGCMIAESWCEVGEGKSS